MCLYMHAFGGEGIINHLWGSLGDMLLITIDSSKKESAGSSIIQFYLLKMYSSFHFVNNPSYVSECTVKNYRYRVNACILFSEGSRFWAKRDLTWTTNLHSSFCMCVMLLLFLSPNNTDGSVTFLLSVFF